MYLRMKMFAFLVLVNFVMKTMIHKISQHNLSLTILHSFCNVKACRGIKQFKDRNFLSEVTKHYESQAGKIQSALESTSGTFRSGSRVIYIQISSAK